MQTSVKCYQIISNNLSTLIRQSFYLFTLITFTQKKFYSWTVCFRCEWKVRVFSFLSNYFSFRDTKKERKKQRDKPKNLLYIYREKTSREEELERRILGRREDHRKNLRRKDLSESIEKTSEKRICRERRRALKKINKYIKHPKNE